MKDLIQIVIREIRAGQSPDFPQTLLRAQLLFEKLYDANRGWQGIEGEVDDAEVSEESIRELREALMTFAQNNRERPDAGSALHALSRCWGYPLREFLLNEMKVHLDAGRVYPLSEADYALFHFGGGPMYDEPISETDYFDVCRKFLDENL